ncbi:MAG: SRPBCC family protein [Pseudohongiella sp.]|nr:SRPBCC family protein [Pseudohongiella sp.]
MSDQNQSAWPQDLLQREIVLTRLIDAPRELVFEIWSNPEHLPKWFGPAGFTLHTKEISIAVGGRWRFDMIAPDGTCYTNRMVFKRIERPLLIEADHGADIDNDPNTFHMLVTFMEQSNGKTVVTLRQIHPSQSHRDRGVAFGAVEYGNQTLDKLAQYVALRP